MNKVYAIRLSTKAIKKFEKLVEQNAGTKGEIFEEMLRVYIEQQAVSSELKKANKQLLEINEYVRLLVKASSELREISDENKMKKTEITF